MFKLTHDHRFLKCRGIDHAIVNNEIPDGVHELPSLLKHVISHQFLNLRMSFSKESCQSYGRVYVWVCGHNKNEILLQATSMMLMASLKVNSIVWKFLNEVDNLI